MPSTIRRRFHLHNRDVEVKPRDTVSQLLKIDEKTFAEKLPFLNM